MGRITSIANTPRVIRPELIESGDLVSIAYPTDDDGVTMTRRGRVSAVLFNAGMRVLMTQEGGVIARLPVTGRQAHTVTLVEREPVQQTPLDMFG